MLYQEIWKNLRILYFYYSSVFSILQHHKLLYCYYIADFLKALLFIIPTLIDINVLVDILFKLYDLCKLQCLTKLKAQSRPIYVFN